jgi:predicted ribosomally synthesized peptide with SipW-like signal peptide
MKKIILSLSVIALVAVVAVGVTRAYFSSTATISGNTFTSGSFALKIDNDPNPNWQNWTDGFTTPAGFFANLYPGYEYSQIIDIKNVGNVDGVASIKLNSNGGPNLYRSMVVKVYYDQENNGFTGSEPAAAQGTLDAYTGTYTLGPIGANKVASVKVVWSIPTSVGNEIMGESIVVDAVFGLNQIQNQ